MKPWLLSGGHLQPTKKNSVLEFGEFPNRGHYITPTQTRYYSGKILQNYHKVEHKGKILQNYHINLHCLYWFPPPKWVILSSLPKEVRFLATLAMTTKHRGAPTHNSAWMWWPLKNRHVLFTSEQVDPMAKLFSRDGKTLHLHHLLESLFTFWQKKKTNNPFRSNPPVPWDVSHGSSLGSPFFRSPVDGRNQMAALATLCSRRKPFGPRPSWREDLQPETSWWFFPTHLKTMRKSNWIISPHHLGDFLFFCNTKKSVKT